MIRPYGKNSMHVLQRVATRSQLGRYASAYVSTCCFRGLSSSSSRDGDGGGDKDWNDAWETAWLPEDASPQSRPPWETDVNFSIDADAEAKAFMEDMDEKWTERREANRTRKAAMQKPEAKEGESSLYGVEKMKKDYRLKKQRIHAALWTKEIEKQEEARLGAAAAADDIDKLMDRCSDIFDSVNDESDDERSPRAPSSSGEFKARPDGWETTSKSDDGSVWEMTQREEDILLQEFERRIAYSKFQIASFIKTHIFSRRRPIDGWKYMIEELGPNARRGKGGVSRLPTLADPSTQPFKEEKTSTASNSLAPSRRR